NGALVAGPLERVNDGAPHGRPTAACSRSHQTIQLASRTSRLFILLCASTRSVKTNGISRSRNPLRQARKLISIWKEYPLDLTCSKSIASRTARRKHLNPPVESVSGKPVIQ